jgi:RTX calcium-binding nonapeptide repeat (4 copies)
VLASDSQSKYYLHNAVDLDSGVPSPSCTILGTSASEAISGTPADDVICAGGGSNTVKGLGGNDTLKGEAGNDQLLGGAGNDTLDGGLGTDTKVTDATEKSIVGFPWEARRTQIHLAGRGSPYAASALPLSLIYPRRGKGSSKTLGE